MPLIINQMLTTAVFLEAFKKSKIIDINSSDMYIVIVSSNPYYSGYMLRFAWFNWYHFFFVLRSARY